MPDSSAAGGAAGGRRGPRSGARRPARRSWAVTVSMMHLYMYGTETCGRGAAKTGLGRRRKLPCDSRGAGGRRAASKPAVRVPGAPVPAVAPTWRGPASQDMPKIPFDQATTAVTAARGDGASRPAQRRVACVRGRDTHTRRGAPREMHKQLFDGQNRRALCKRLPISQSLFNQMRSLNVRPCLHLFKNMQSNETFQQQNL